MVIVVQQVRTSDCGSEGRGFESHHSPKDYNPPKLVKKASFGEVQKSYNPPKLVKKASFGEVQKTEKLPKQLKKRNFGSSSKKIKVDYVSVGPTWEVPPTTL